MIDPGVFKNEWAMLCERFRMTGDREPSQPMVRRYFEYLNARMDTEAFVEAATRVYAEAEFFPKPADFLPSKGNRAALQWEQVHGMLSNSAQSLDALDPVAKRCVRSMGGLFQIGSDIKALDFKRKAFTELYAELGDGDYTRYLVTAESRKLVTRVMDGAA